MQGYLLAAMALFRTLFIVGLISFVGRIAGTPFNAVSTAKVTPYECGFSPFEKLDRNQLFIFYRLAVFFIIFEAELIFLYP